jgi:hypothetical protein
MLQHSGSAMLKALSADGPAADRADAMMLYGQFVGSWDIAVTEYRADGSTQKRRGEWHFDWVLEGRAIEDVFIVPPRNARKDVPLTGNRYGATMRVFDPASGLWRIVWFNPVTCAFDVMLGRRIGDEIVQNGCNPDGTPFRWIFSDVTDRSFHWRAETSPDGGQNWTLIVEFHATRAE